MSVRMLARRENGGEDLSILFGAPVREAGAMLGQKQVFSQWKDITDVERRGAASLRRRLAGPDTGGEGADGGEVEFFVELDGGAILRGDGERQLTKLHRTESFGGGLHQHAAEAMTLIAGEDTDLGGM